MMKTILATLCLLALQSAANEIEIFTSEDLIGYSEKITEYRSDLHISGMGDSTKSARLTGIWILYEDRLFNQFGFLSESYFSWGNNSVINSFKELNGKISSLRYAGADEGLKINSLNIYEAPGFMGEEQYFFEDTASMAKHKFGASIIVSGCQPWTIYSEADYKGDNVCLSPSSTDKCEPGFFLKPSDFGGFANKASSARIGCFSERVVKGQVVPPNTSRMFKGY